MRLLLSPSWALLPPPMQPYTGESLPLSRSMMPSLRNRGRWRGPSFLLAATRKCPQESNPNCTSRVKLHKLPKAASDYSTLHTASLVEKYLGRFQVPLLNANAKYPPGRGDDEFKIMLENEQWKHAIETNGGHSTPLTSQLAPSQLVREGRAVHH